MTKEQKELINQFILIPDWAVARRLEALDELEHALKEMVQK